MARNRQSFPYLDKPSPFYGRLNGLPSPGMAIKRQLFTFLAGATTAIPHHHASSPFLFSMPLHHSSSPSLFTIPHRPLWRLSQPGEGTEVWVLKLVWAVGRGNREILSLPDDGGDAEGAVRGVVCPVGSGFRKILSLPDDGGGAEGAVRGMVCPEGSGF